ncbi:MAG: hypothetical protein MJY60_07610 [Bacteroidales bacterium]|nr:hypothetical protein [Bacteroidales bacterium]
MNKTFIAVATMTMVAAVSCQKDNMEPQPAGKTVSIKASVEQQVSTRTALSGDTVVWSEGDALAVYGVDNPGTCVAFSYNGTPGVVEGEFWGTEVTGTKVAVYPQSIVAEGTGLVSADGRYSVPVTIPAEQTYVEGSFSNNANVAIAVGTDSFAFKNVMSVLKLQFYGTTARNITKVQLAAAEPLCGEATLSVAADGTDPQLVFDEAKSSKMLTLNVPNVAFSTDEAAPTVYYFVVPANSLTSGFTVSVENTASNDTFYALAKTKTDNTTARSNISEMPVKSISFTARKSGLANTLICVPGGSVVDIYPLQPVTGKLLGHADSFSALANYFSEGEDKGSCANYTNGSAKYTSADKGCRIYALRDFDSKILWTFNVWVTETPGDLTLADGSVIMDRNLCAKAGERSDEMTNNQQLRGLLYQWGRKDPLFNQSTNKVECSAETGTLEYVTANPLSFIYPVDGQPCAGDWMWERNNNLWGTTKTEYDPCPAGYKVPDGSATTAFWTATDMLNHAGAYDNTFKGYDFNVLDDETSFFLTGYYCSMNGDTPTTYTNGYYWCCNSVKMTNGAYYGRVFKFGNSSITGKSTLVRYSGAQIRCQKIL